MAMVAALTTATTDTVISFNGSLLKGWSADRDQAP
jgi:hypothetical protein